MPRDVGVVLVCAFDPVAELGNASGLLALSTELAARLIAERRVEATADHASEPLRYVRGSRAYAAARQALRDARAGVMPHRGPGRPRKIPRLEEG